MAAIYAGLADKPQDTGIWRSTNIIIGMQCAGGIEVMIPTRLENAHQAAKVVA